MSPHWQPGSQPLDHPGQSLLIGLIWPVQCFDLALNELLALNNRNISHNNLDLGVLGKSEDLQTLVHILA